MLCYELLVQIILYELYLLFGALKVIVVTLQGHRYERAQFLNEYEAAICDMDLLKSSINMSSATVRHAAKLFFGTHCCYEGFMLENGNSFVKNKHGSKMGDFD